MMGIVVCFLMAGSALAASGVLTVTRAISQPACSNWWICSTVALTSAVSGVVMDWTTIGAPPPMGTFPTRICLVLRRLMNMLLAALHSQSRHLVEGLGFLINAICRQPVLHAQEVLRPLLDVLIRQSQ